MSSLNLYPLPYTASNPPAELFRDIETASGRSDTTAFETDLDERDMFLGRRRCVVCGDGDRTLQHCHIIGGKDKPAWNLLKTLGWVPTGVKAEPQHESRNGLTMCPNHHQQFDDWRFFIRFEPNIKKYIFVLCDSYEESQAGKRLHGKAIALDFKDKRSPLPLLFLVHEYMVRGRNFFQRTSDVEITCEWQDWITTEDVVDDGNDGSFAFKRSAAPSSFSTGRPMPWQLPSTDAPPTGTQPLLTPPNGDLVAQLMAVQRTMPSWKEWQKETMGWEGTAEENIKRYVENVGVENAGVENSGIDN
ncbi:hypothetical protein CONPUDRAFT_110500 [Coniophora puteana RWD-64-598 SS2]|uniref:HNH nuclease domain-containing protein n=1 Tax=Coniophora puteana (strain RWD-64-598) TaxID=741705 RepID=A0A5M3MC80_CONPW|nr:uncharacterized protein CONPUDRAFT_110500 [Coniophora puteana RWD-64-598 SS2]EIW76852.1 hypothetical protein CONPUDRAFT_110500 [Coniophora puteana RWD-64-598 SS2]